MAARQKLMVLGLLVAFATSARADEAPAWTWGPTGFMYLQSKAVQDELKLKPEQRAKVKELADERKESLGNPGKLKEFADLAEITIGELLQPEQAKRLRQIQLQKQGPAVLQNPTIAAELGLTDKQKEMLNAMSATGPKGPPQLVISKGPDNKIQIGQKPDPNAAAARRAGQDARRADREAAGEVE